MWTLTRWWRQQVQKQRLRLNQNKFRMIVRNPRPRKIIDWLERRSEHVEQLKLSGCKRCGPVICGIVSKLFDKYCGDLEACLLYTSPSPRDS